MKTGGASSFICLYVNTSVDSALFAATFRTRHLVHYFVMATIATAFVARELCIVLDVSFR